MSRRRSGRRGTPAEAILERPVHAVSKEANPGFRRDSSVNVRLRGPRATRTNLRERLDALGPAPSAELLLVLMLDFERADRIREFWSYPQSRAFAELLIDCDEDRTLRAVRVGMLREGEKPRR
jgi:hypothetical protein